MIRQSKGTQTTLRKVHSLATPPFGTVHAVIVLWACVTTFSCASAARKLDIYTTLTNLPTSCTLAVAMQPGRRLDEASCEKPAEGYREYFHDGCYQALVSAILLLRTFAICMRAFGEWTMYTHEFATYRFYRWLGGIAKYEI